MEAGGPGRPGPSGRPTTGPGSTDGRLRTRLRSRRRSTPAPASGVLERLARRLETVVGPGAVIRDPTERATYSSDGLTGWACVPGLVVLPTTTLQVAEVVATCDRFGVPFVARGAGSGLSGGALPEADGVLLVTARMRRILELSPRDRLAVVEPGVTNAAVSLAASPYGLFYAPDPSSQVVCSIGGNIAENSGGAHCLEYGFTTHHVLGVELVLPDGRVVELGGDVAETPGYDLRGLVIGSEGTLGVVTAATLRLTPRPARAITAVASFPGPEAAGAAVSAIVAAGVVPAAVEMMDALAVEACEAATHAGFDTDAGAVLLVEVDGPELACEATLRSIAAACRDAGGTNWHVAADAADRDRLWRGRKAAFAAAGRLSPAYLVQDGVIPRDALGRVLVAIGQMAAKRGLRVANVFHAGDGNLHPLVLYDPARPGETERAEELAAAIVSLCVDEGGSITGEHGVGVDKVCAMTAMFDAADLAVMARVRRAFDPKGLCNPGKLLPTPRLCGERPGPYRPHPLETAGVAERW